MCEAGYDLKLLLKNEENIITETIYPLFFTKRVLERS